MGTCVLILFCTCLKYELKTLIWKVVLKLKASAKIYTAIIEEAKKTAI